MIFDIIFGKEATFETQLATVVSSEISINDILQEYQSILADITSEATSEQEKPYLINIAGIPGAGKSTYVKNNRDSYTNALYISFDKIMESLSGYTKDYKNEGAKFAFSRWEPIAKVLGYQTLEHVVDKKYNILFEHSNAIIQHMQLYKYMKEQGYTLEIKFIEIDLSIAIERAMKRERAVPEELILQRNKLLKELNDEYKKIVDKFDIIS